MKKEMEDLAKFIIMGPRGCCLWIGSRDRGGYGRVRQEKRHRLAHRVVYELMAGPIPAGLELDHLCRTPACVNWQHLDPVTHRDNMLRSASPTVLLYRTNTCKRGHSLADAYVSRSGRRCRPCALAYQRAAWRTGKP